MTTYVKVDKKVYVEVGRIIVNQLTGGILWGTINGTLTDQTDLATEFASPAITKNYTEYSVIPIGVPNRPGVEYWDAAVETISLIQNGAVLQYGQELQYHARNDSGVGIVDGVPAMATGTLGASGKITVAAMDGTDEDFARFLLGLATYDIANGADGKITSFGRVNEVDTSMWNDGDVLWVSSANPGVLVNVEPPLDKIGMPVAFVSYSHATLGILTVRVSGIDEHRHVQRDSGWYKGLISMAKTTGDVTGGGIINLSPIQDGNDVKVAVDTSAITIQPVGADWPSATTLEMGVTLVLRATAGCGVITWTGWSFVNAADTPDGSNIVTYAMYRIKKVANEYYIKAIMEG